MKLSLTRPMTLLALAASVLVITPSARAATANSGDIFLGVRASGSTGSGNSYVINLGPASQFETGTTPRNLVNIGADLTSVFGPNWNTRANVLWGIAGTTGPNAPVGDDPAKTVFGSRSTANPWTRQNDPTHGAAANKLLGMFSAFKLSPSQGVTASNAVLQLPTFDNNWASYQPGGINAGAAPGTSFAFFNPSVEASFENGVAGASLRFYRVKPATNAGELGLAGDYLGRFFITSTGAVSFLPPAANGVNTVSIASATYTVGEDAGSLDVTVVRSGDLSTTASVTISATGGDAVSPDDYTFTGGLVSFAAGEAEKTQTITVINRSGFQGNRAINLGLSAPTNATLGTNGTSVVTISEDIEPSEINLVDTLVSVNAESPSVTIRLVRSGGGSPVTVDIATADDTAVAGTNYTAPTGGAQTVTFDADETEATATISLLNAAITTNKKFSVSLTNAGANASIGTSGPTVVRILAADSTLPTVVINTPTANQVIPTADGPSVIVSGIAGDNIELDRVQTSLNGAAFVNANGTTTWSRTVTAIGGLNTVVVRATDARGNFFEATRSFNYVQTGTLTVVTSPANDALGSVTPVIAQGTLFEVGKTYTFKATPKAGSAFLGWAGNGLTAPATEGPVLTFVYTAAMLNSTLTASFGALPFAATEIGEFNGLVSPHTGTVSSNSTNGSMKLTLTKTGSFSGTLLIDGFKLTIPASLFTGAGNARFGVNSASTLMVARTNKPSLELSNVHWDIEENTITGVVKQYYRSAVTAESRFTLDRAGFSSTNKIPATSPYLANAGLFTVILQAKEQAEELGLTTADYPQGDGIGTITISNAGVVKLTGKLADDTAITASVPLSTDLKAPLYAQLYTSKGSFTALVQLNSLAVDSDLKAANSLWFRPWQNVQWYPWGWEEGIKVDLLGASYLKTGTVIPGLPTTPNTTTANADLIFSEGALDESINAAVNISPTNIVKTLDTPSAPATSFTLALKAASGDISGTFTHSDGTKPKYVGKVYQKGPAAGAYGYFLTLKPKVVDGLGQSGGLSLTHK